MVKGGVLAVTAVLLAVVPAVVQTAVQARELTVKVDEVSLSDALRIPTGEFRMTGGRFEPVFDAKKPAPGSIFLVVTATFQNAGAPFELPRTEVVLNPGQIGGRTPIEWHEELSPMLMSMSLHVSGAAVGSIRMSPDAEVLAAARNGDAVVLRRALDAGGSTNAKTAGSGETALMLAAENGHIEVVRVLLQRGTDVNASTAKMTRTTRADGAGVTELDLLWTALSAATANGHQAVADLLKKSGAK